MPYLLGLIHLDRIAHYGLPILDNKPELRVMIGEH
jgi:hypothetical protein